MRDGLGFGYDQSEPVAGIALGAAGAARSEGGWLAGGAAAAGSAPPADAPGPAIVGVLDLRGGVDLRDAMLIEDGIVPGALRGVTHEIVTTAAMLQQLSDRRGCGMTAPARIRWR